MESMTEQEARRMQQARFERLARVVVEPLHRYLLRRTSADMVDDVLSETMLVLWRRIDEVPGLGAGALPDPDPDPGDVLPWCYGVARRCLANARRSDGRRLGSTPAYPRPSHSSRAALCTSALASGSVEPRP
ncbi:RNA polymerase sigma factor, partial [Streptomyces prunicolor]|uniref:RNA polymerase sigma factor n=1 Tax=Streptomyces prunicolor TaxID=67348 RepID=UPI0034922752